MRPYQQHNLDYINLYREKYDQVSVMSTSRITP